MKSRSFHVRWAGIGLAVLVSGALVEVAQSQADASPLLNPSSAALPSRLALEAFYTPLDDVRPPSTGAENDPLFNLRSMFTYAF